MSKQEIDDYIASVDEPKRSTLRQLRRTIEKIIPEAEPGIAYGAPAYRVGGNVVAGFAAFKDHLSYLPHSGSVFPRMSDELTGYRWSSGALQFAVDEPLPEPIVRRLIELRVDEAEAKRTPKRSGGAARHR
jgi:uncharacterized protein YdhG (YjbR/CyaY superfamily)